MSTARPLLIPSRSSSLAQLRMRLVLPASMVMIAAGALTAGVAQASVHQQDAAADSIGVRLLDVSPATAADPRAQMYIVDPMRPGTQISRHIEVTSTMAAPTQVSLYAAAASITDGAFAIADGRSANELSSWVSVEPATISVPAQGTATATVTVAVPSGVSAGERYAVVWVESSAPDVPAGGIRYVSRIGIRMYIAVGVGGDPPTDFEITGLTATQTAEGAPAVIADVHNTGQRALDVHGSLTLLAGPAGLTAGPFAADMGVTVGVGSTAAVRVVLDPTLPAGPWAANLSLTSGPITRTAQGDLTFPSTGSQVVPLTDQAPAHWPPWALAATALLLAAALAGTLAVRSVRVHSLLPK